MNRQFLYTTESCEKTEEKTLTQLWGRGSLLRGGDTWTVAWKVCVCVCVCVSCSVVSDSAIPWTIACQAPLSMEFSRQEYWSGLPFPSPGDLPDPGIKPGFQHCRQILYHLSHLGSLWKMSRSLRSWERVLQAEGALCSKGIEVLEVNLRNIRVWFGENGEEDRRQIWRGPGNTEGSEF